MIFPVGLKVLGQMLDPPRQKCDLHIRAAGIFFVQLELLQTQRWIALCHGEALILDEEPVFATGQRGQARIYRSAIVMSRSGLPSPFWW
jgi:hypothetical protein